MKKHPEALHRDALTLIELLVVISIIAVLAALLFPAVSKVRQTAHLTQCTQNLRNIGIGIQMYANENEGYLVGSQTPFWFDAIKPYLPTTFDKTGEPITKHVFSCPAAKFLAGGGQKTTYGKTSFYNDIPARRVRRLIAFPQPSKLIVVGDSLENKRELFTNAGDEFGLDFRHGGKANLLFMDWHIEARSPEEIPFEGGDFPWTDPTVKKFP